MTLNTGWTEKEERILKKMWGDGQSASKCGAILKRSRNSVISKVHRMGLKDHGSGIQRAPRKKPLKSTTARTEGIKDKVYYIPFEAGKPIKKEYFKVADKTPVLLDELTTSSCRWPLDNADGKHVGYCGANKTGTAYCDEHAAIAYPALRGLKNQKQEEVA